MKTNLSFLTLLFCVGTALAQHIQPVVPGGLDNEEGDSSLAEPFNSPSFRFQQVFAASEFAYLGVGTTARIDRISFRIDGASMDRVLLYFDGGSFSLSSTERGPDDLSSIFQENRGFDPVGAVGGAFRLGAFLQLGSTPQPFFEVVTFTTPFYYNPAMGNLLIEFGGVGGRAFLPGALDGQSTVGDSMSSVFATSNLLPSGTTSTFGLVTKFDFTIVPEPATWLLVTAAAALFAVHCFGLKLSARDDRRLAKSANLRARPKA